MSDNYGAAMRVSARTTFVLTSAVCLSMFGITACAEGDASDGTSANRSSVTSADSSDAESSEVDVDSSQAANGPSGDCGVIAVKLDHNELASAMNSGTVSSPYPDPDRIGDLVAATPVGGQQQFLDDACVQMSEYAASSGGVSADDLIKSFGSSPASQAAVLVSGYSICQEIEAGKEPFGDGAVGLDVAAKSQSTLRAAQDYLCPQITFPR